MSSGHADEETPLLLARNGKKQATPLPWFQFAILLFLQLAEPLTSNVIYPFAPEVYFFYMGGSLINLCISASSFVVLALPTATRVEWDIMSVSWYVVWNNCKYLPHNQLWCIAIIIFLDPGFYCIALESAIRPYRPKAHYSNRTSGALNLDVLLWTLQNLLGTGVKVSARAFR